MSKQPPKHITVDGHRYILAYDSFDDYAQSQDPDYRPAPKLLYKGVQIYHFPKWVQNVTYNTFKTLGAELKKKGKLSPEDQRRYEDAVSTLDKELAKHQKK